MLAWGGGAFGQLCNSTTSNSDVPVKVRLPKGATVKALAAGDGHGLARTTAGLYSWGYNSSGQLGDGTTTERDTPVKVVILIRGRPLGHVTCPDRPGAADSKANGARGERRSVLPGQLALGHPGP